MQGHCFIIAHLEKSTGSGTYTNLSRCLLNTSLENISMFEEVGEKDQRIMLYGFFFNTNFQNAHISCYSTQYTTDNTGGSKDSRRQIKVIMQFLKMHRKKTGRNCANISNLYIYIYILNIYAVRLWVMVCLHLTIFSTVPLF